MRRNISGALVVLTLIGALAFAAEGATLSSQRVIHSDELIAEQVAKRLRRYTQYTIFDDVNIGVDAGVVTLAGRVTMPYKADDMVRLASRVEGVREVRNDIKTLPVSIYDDRLRVSIARQIYRDPLFLNYAIQVNPPIHIIVEHGRVTLTGAVGSKIERQKAEIIARSTFGVFNVDNRLLIG
jgi:hyperosmotically inducible protein